MFGLKKNKNKIEKERAATTIPRKNLITYKVVTKAKCNSHENMSSDSVGNCVSLRIEMLFHGHTITKRRHLNMIRIAKQLIPIDVLCPRDPRSRQKDARFQPRMIPASVNPAKDVRTGCPDTPSDGFVSHCSSDQSALFSKSKSLSPFLRMREPFSIVSEALPLFNGRKTFWLVMMALRQWQSHHRSASGCQKSWKMTCRHVCPFALQAAECRL